MFVVVTLVNYGARNGAAQNYVRAINLTIWFENPNPLDNNIDGGQDMVPSINIE